MYTSNRLVASRCYRKSPCIPGLNNSIVALVMSEHIHKIQKITTGDVFITIKLQTFCKLLAE